jgi:hypothetical protein
MIIITRQVRCGHWNFDLNVWERPVLDVVSDKGPLILSCPGFRRELGSERTAAIRLFGQEIGANETHLYRTHFHSRYAHAPTTPRTWAALHRSRSSSCSL